MTKKYGDPCLLLLEYAEHAFIFFATKRANLPLPLYTAAGCRYFLVGYTHGHLQLQTRRTKKKGLPFAFPNVRISCERSFFVMEV